MSDRKVWLAVVRDGHTPDSWIEESLGEVGVYDHRVRFKRLGYSRRPSIKLRITSPVVVDVLGLLVDAELGL